ncbi:NUDIX domain-containing protein [Aureimonas sp. SK2]|uniref:NUDIX domain-containing protein n=1 Tax=Aureimonas sp. SK2 TaxID=3015992 RepID=UPI00387EB0C5
MIDALFRITYFLGYRCARVVWRFTSPRINGALVAVWHDGRVLLVRNSYRTEWTLPGGGVDANEDALQAAAREAKEELSLEISEDALIPGGAMEMIYHHRRDHVTFFHTIFEKLPIISIDNREITATRMESPCDALKLNLTPHVRRFLENHSLNSQ